MQFIHRIVCEIVSTSSSEVPLWAYRSEGPLCVIYNIYNIYYRLSPSLQSRCGRVQQQSGITTVNKHKAQAAPTLRASFLCAHLRRSKWDRDLSHLKNYSPSPDVPLNAPGFLRLTQICSSKNMNGQACSKFWYNLHNIQHNCKMAHSGPSLCNNYLAKCR